MILRLELTVNVNHELGKTDVTITSSDISQTVYNHTYCLYAAILSLDKQMELFSKLERPDIKINSIEFMELCRNITFGELNSKTSLDENTRVD